MKNIDSAFRMVRNFTIVVIIGCMAVSAYSILKSFELMEHANAKVYILAGGKIFAAYQSDRKVNLEVEARDHIRTFHEYFFTLDPDDKVIQANITRALYLGDGSVKKQYDDLRESGYFTNLIAGNISQRIHVDSIYLDLNSYPYYFKCYATERITRTTSLVTRSLVTEGALRAVSRSDNDPHGFLIERWTIDENKDIKVEKR